MLVTLLPRGKLQLSLEALNMLRFIAPGVIALFFAGFLGAITGAWKIALPTDLSKIPYTLSVVIPSIFYYVSRARHLSNGYFHRRVNENVRSRLIRISGLADRTEFTWLKIRSAFYTVVDSDESLKKQAARHYFNGFLWTTVADLRALSVIYAFAAFGMYLLGYGSAAAALFLFLGIALITILLSELVTRKHQSLFEEQADIIELNYRDKLRQLLEKIGG